MLLRRALFQLHLYAGLTVGALLALSGLSGSALLLAGPLEEALPPGRAQAAGAPASLDAVLAAVREAEHGAAPRLIRLAPHPGAAHVAWMDGHGERRLLVDPASAQVVGVRTASREPLGLLRALHVRLLGGARGEAAVGALGLCLVLLCLSGLWLWWPGRRKLRQGLTLRRPLRGRRAAFDLHKLTGLAALAFLLLSGLTGSALAFGKPLTAALQALALLPPTPPLPPLASAAPPLPLSLLLARADAALPGARSTRVDLPAAPGAPLRVRKRFAEELHPFGMSAVSLDPASGAVLRVEDARRAPLAARLLALRYPLHLGAWGGPVGRALALLNGLTPAALFLTGLLLWLSRLRAQARARGAPSPSPSPRPTP